MVLQMAHFCKSTRPQWVNTKQTNRNLSGQLNLYVAHFCVTRHIHTMVTGGLLALKPNAYSSTATQEEQQGHQTMTQTRPIIIIHISLASVVVIKSWNNRSLFDYFCHPKWSLFGPVRLLILGLCLKVMSLWPIETTKNTQSGQIRNQ